VTLLLNCELVSRVRLCLFSVFPDIVKDCPKIRNLCKIFLRSFKNVAPGTSRWTSLALNDSNVVCLQTNPKNANYDYFTAISYMAM